MCGHPQIEDISTAQHHLDNDAAMVDVLEGFGVAESKDPIGIESAFWNASLDGCKGLPTLRSSDDEANVGGQEH